MRVYITFTGLRTVTKNVDVRNRNCEIQLTCNEGTFICKTIYVLHGCWFIYSFVWPKNFLKLLNRFARVFLKNYPFSLRGFIAPNKFEFN